MKSDERYHDAANREVQTGAVPATSEPHQELHLRVTTLEGIVNRQQEEIDDVQAGLAALRQDMDSVFTELGLS